MSRSVAIIVGPGVGNEYEAIRQSLEYFGLQVTMSYLGRPNHFLELIGGKRPDIQHCSHWILSLHGEDGRFILPELAEEVYTREEPRSPLSAKDILAHGSFNQQVILNTGCTLGQKAVGEAFLRRGAKAYIGARDYVEGNASLLFIIRFYYEWITHNKTEWQAFQAAKGIDQETALFTFYGNQV